MFFEIVIILLLITEIEILNISTIVFFFENFIISWFIIPFSWDLVLILHLFHFLIPHIIEFFTFLSSYLIFLFLVFVFRFSFPFSCFRASRQYSCNLSCAPCSWDWKKNGRRCWCHGNSLRGRFTAVDWYSYSCTDKDYFYEVPPLSLFLYTHTHTHSHTHVQTRTYRHYFIIILNRVTSRSSAIPRQKPNMSMTEYFNRAALNRRYRTYRTYWFLFVLIFIKELSSVSFLYLLSFLYFFKFSGAVFVNS